jgi:hypothetical protein
MDNRLTLPSNYDKIILLFYPKNAGGNFLNLCLGFSNDYVFQDINLAKKQINGKFTLDDKIRYVNQKLFLSMKTKIWTDLDLGHSKLFGVNVNDLFYTNFDNFDIDSFYQEDINFLMNNDVWISTGGHNLRIFKKWYNFFPNATIIYYYNWDKFALSRVKEIQKTWNVIRKSHWQELYPSTIEEFYSLPKIVKQEIIKYFPFLYYQLILTNRYKRENENYITNLEKSGGKVFHWDVDWYNHEHIFLEKLKDLYKKLNLEISWKDSQILNYRKKWLQTIF